MTHLTLAGSSTLTLSAAATYMGNTTISSGATLQLGAANVIPQVASTSFVNLDGTLDLNTFNQTIKNLNGGGTIDTVAGGTPILTIAGRTGPGLFNGVIQNTAGTLSLNVTGFLELTNNNTYTGTTTIGVGWYMKSLVMAAICLHFRQALRLLIMAAFFD